MHDGLIASWTLVLCAKCYMELTPRKLTVLEEGVYNRYIPWERTMHGDRLSHQDVAGPVVFVVDDDSAIQKALSRLLKSNGFEVRTFSTPIEFLKNHDS